MLAMRAAAMNMREAVGSTTPEMAAIVMVPVMLVVRIVEPAIAAPIAINERAIIPIIIAVVIIQLCGRHRPWAGSGTGPAIDAA
jgi:hypothetical protein